MHARTSRFFIPVLLALGVALSWPAAAAFDEALDQVLDSSLKDRKGVVLYVMGQSISGRVVKMDKDTVELTSREFARIVVRRERIDAATGN